MQRSDYVLAIISAGREQASFSPVQVQKLFFLLDREIPQFVGGPYFDFAPYDFGPFDKDVYGELDGLYMFGLAEKNSDGRYRSYSLTPVGLARGLDLFAEFPEDVQNYISQMVTWVRSLSFSQLVSAIYRAYPEMKENSIFQQ